MNESKAKYLPNLRMGIFLLPKAELKLSGFLVFSVVIYIFSELTVFT